MVIKNTNRIKRLIKSMNKLIKAIKKRKKAQEERIWIENNPQIHLLNYPFYKLIKCLRKWMNG